MWGDGYPAWSVSVTSAPATEPVSRTEAKLHLRVDTTTDDTWIDNAIQAAREYAETVTGRAFITQTLALKLEGFPNGQPLWLPRPPLVSVTSVAYVDPNGNTQSWASNAYELSQPSGPRASYARILPLWGTQYPVTRPQMEAVTVTYVAGYGAASAVPQAIKSAILLLVGHLYANREAVVMDLRVADLPLGVQALLSPYMVTQW